MLYYIVSPIFTCVISFSLGTFFVFKRIRFIGFPLLCYMIFGWSFFYTLWQLSTHADQALRYCQILTVFSVWMPFSFLQYTLNFNNKGGTYRLVNIANVIIAILFTGLSFTPLMVAKVAPALFFPFWPKAGPLYPVFLLHFFMSYMLGYWVLLTAPKKPTQVAYFLVTGVLGMLGGATNFFLWFDVFIPPFGNICLPICLLIFAYAMTKHELLDIRIVVGKGLAFGFSALLFATIYLGVIVWPYFKFSSQKIDLPFLVLTVLYTTIVGSYFKKFQYHLQTFSDWVLFQKKIERETYDKVVIGLHHEINSPLTAISLSAHHLKIMTNLPDPAPQLVGMIHGELRRISDLLAKIRQATHIQSKSR